MGADEGNGVAVAAAIDACSASGSAEVLAGTAVRSDCAGIRDLAITSRVAGGTGTRAIIRWNRAGDTSSIQAFTIA